MASARKLLNKESVDFILDLRTTKHHINAIETGELRIFYGPPFYLDLLRRYASILNFSDQQIYIKTIDNFENELHFVISQGEDERLYFSTVLGI